MNDWFGWMPPELMPPDIPGGGSGPAMAPTGQSGGPRAPRIGGILGGIARQVTPDKLQGLAAIIRDLDGMGSQDKFARFQQGQERRGKEDAEAERRKRMAQAYAQATSTGHFDPRAYAAALAAEGEVPSIGEALGIEEAMTPKPERIWTGDLNNDGANEIAYDSDIRAYLDRNRGAPDGAPQSDPPPPPGFRPVRPTEAPASVGAAPQGFGDYDELQSFVRENTPAPRFTSGYRSQAEQDALVHRGVTRAKRSAHTYGMGQDFVPDVPFEQWDAIAENLRRSGRFRKVIVEDGGPGRGTAPHIHLEPM